MRAPERATRRAVSNSWCSLSIVQGPAMMTTSLPPTATPRALTTVFSRFQVRLVSLYGSLTRTTSCTPSNSSNSRVSMLATSPTTPRTVWSLPVERWTSKPREISSATTFSTFSSAACFSITMTMSSPSLLRGRFALHAPRLVDDAFEKTAARRAAQGSRGLGLDVQEHLLLPLRGVDGEREHALDLADLHGVLGALVEELDEDFVHAVDGVAEAGELLFGVDPFHRNQKPLPASRRGPDRFVTFRSSAPPRGGASCAPG